MEEVENDKSMLALFTKDSHHTNITPIMVSQNLFHQGKYSRTMSLNCDYFAIFDNPRDKRQITTLASQMFPEKHEKLLEVFQDATAEPYGYMFLDFHPSNETKDFKLQSNVLDSKKRIIYIDDV